MGITLLTVPLEHTHHSASTHNTHSWVVLGAVVALIQPGLFNWIPTPWITYALALTMLGMGLTMQVSGSHQRCCHSSYIRMLHPKCTYVLRAVSPLTGSHIFIRTAPGLLTRVQCPTLAAALWVGLAIHRHARPWLLALTVRLSERVLQSECGFETAGKCRAWCVHAFISMICC